MNTLSQPSRSSRSAYVPPAPPWPRYINALVGTWLFASTFLWRHTPSAQTNTWLIGLMMATAALWAVRTPAIRWFNTALAVWLALSTFAISEARPLTYYHNFGVAIVAFVVSVIANPAERRV